MTSEYSIPVREIPIATLGRAENSLSASLHGSYDQYRKVMLSLSHGATMGTSIHTRPCF